MRKGSGLILIPKLSQWNVIMAQLLHNHQVEARQLNHTTNQDRSLLSTQVLTTGIHCMMATPRNWPCLGYRDDLQNRSGDRRLMTILSIQKIVSYWKEMMKKKLEGLKSTPDLGTEVGTPESPGYICRRCFGRFERYRRELDTLHANLECALAYMPTVRLLSVIRLDLRREQEKRT